MERNKCASMRCLVARIRTILFAASLFSVLSCAGLWAQSTAQITGSVKDQTGAVLPGVEVTVTHTGTGLTRSMKPRPSHSTSATAEREPADPIEAAVPPRDDFGPVMKVPATPSKVLCRVSEPTCKQESCYR